MPVFHRSGRVKATINFPEVSRGFSSTLARPVRVWEAAAWLHRFLQLFVVVLVIAVFQAHIAKCFPSNPTTHEEEGLGG